MNYVDQSAFQRGQKLQNDRIDAVTEGLSKAESDIVTLPELMLAMHPVGCIYTSVVSTSPATLFGGTWAAFGAGRVLVGIDSADTSFDVVEETGGAKTRTLALTNLPALNSGYLSYKASGTDGITATNKTYGASIDQGGGQAFSILPPYIVVYMWKRVS